MGLKKYEIITVGSDKRVRALRSWQVGDRYVNIGDVGGIVYDEKTLSQDGLCWLFRGNFGFPGARIGGDSVVDVGEATLGAAGTPNVDILGSSVVVGSKIQFESGQTAADAVVLTAADFEQGSLNYAAGVNWEDMKASSPSYIRTKSPIFAGGASVTLKCEAPGYLLHWFALDRDGIMTTASATVATGEGVTTKVAACQYFLVRLTKNPADATVPADATAAAITFTGTYGTKLSVIDSRVEVNPANATGTTTIRPGGVHTIASGVKYPDSVIRNSKVVINGHATSNRIIRLMSEFIGCNVAIDATSDNAQSVGIYSNVNNLTFTGAVSADSLNVNVPRGIQATDCDNFAVSPTVFPGLKSARPADRPFIFQGCNVPGGRFYNHAKIANTYKNIDFAKAQADLGKSIASDGIFASSEVEGMYRIYFAVFGALVESYDSVKSLNIADLAKSYGTTIYKDAYFNGAFDIAGTNVFGNTKKHDASNTQVMAVQGNFNATAVGGVISGIVSSGNWVVVAEPFRLNSSEGIKITDSGVTPFDTLAYAVDANNKIVAVSTKLRGDRTLPTFATHAKVYVAIQKVDGSPITPDDVKGITVTTYNGCKLVNTKETAAVIAGNVRVEDNATLIDTSVTGTGYFGGNSIVQAPSALVGQLPIAGAAFMSDNAVFAPTVANATSGLSLLEMKDNAVFAGNLTGASINYNITMADNARFLGSHGSRSGFIMRGNSFVAAAGAVASACRGLMIMKDDARVEGGVLTAIGYITLCGKYRQTAGKTWTGKCVIDSQDAPTYDNNVKTQYDF